MSATRILVIYGTRPEAIKLAPLIKGLRHHPDLEPVVAVTGQHREMLDQVNELFGIVPEIDLRLARSDSTLASMTAAAVSALDNVVSRVNPSAVIVQGDTTSTFAGALASFYRRVPVVHLEAGLRTGSKSSPFPEEMNRLLVSRLAELHLCATERNRRALLVEGIAPDSAFVIGNTVIDALFHTVGLDLDYTDPLLKILDVDPRKMILVTAHRRESWGAGMIRIGQALAEIARDQSLILVVPVHKNPAVRRDLLPLLVGLPNVLVVEPADYVTFVKLMVRAEVILTDSGGVQEEAPALGTPVLVLRDETERVEAVEAGVAHLVGTDAVTIVEATRRLLADSSVHDVIRGVGSPFGDGQASRRAVALIAGMLGYDAEVVPALASARHLVDPDLQGGIDGS